jgi:hypothetical protein
MPRKQRFKPSRKPKPIPQSEAAAIGHDARDMSSHNIQHSEPHVETGGSGRKSDDDSSPAPEPDQR